MRGAGRRNGFILVAVLWLLAIFGVVALGYSRATRFKSLEIANEIRLAEEDHLMWSGLERAAFHCDLYLRNREAFLLPAGRGGFGEMQRSVMWYPRFETYPLDMGGHVLHVRVEPAGARMGLAGMTPERWSAVLYACGVTDERVAQEIMDAVADWQDEDNLQHAEGAEQDYYDGLEPAYACKNAPIESLDELLLIRGVTPELYYGSDERPGLIHFLDVNGQAERLDINAAHPLTFAIVPGLSPREAAVFVLMRQEAPFTAMAEATELLSLEAAGELERYFHVLPESAGLELRISRESEPGPDARIETRTFVQ